MPALRRAVSGEAEGTVAYEWTDGGFILLLHVDLDGNRGLEVIGHEHRYGEDPSADIRSRYYGFSEGETLDYTYQIEDETLTIWMGERNSRRITRAPSARMATHSPVPATTRAVAATQPCPRGQRRAEPSRLAPADSEAGPGRDGTYSQIATAASKVQRSVLLGSPFTALFYAGRG